MYLPASRFLQTMKLWLWIYFFFFLILVVMRQNKDSHSERGPPAMDFLMNMNKEKQQPRDFKVLQNKYIIILYLIKW